VTTAFASVWNNAADQQRVRRDTTPVALDRQPLLCLAQPWLWPHVPAAPARMKNAPRSRTYRLRVRTYDHQQPAAVAPLRARFVPVHRKAHALSQLFSRQEFNSLLIRTHVELTAAVSALGLLARPSIRGQLVRTDACNGNASRLHP
jgi:hypothetical protein